MLAGVKSQHVLPRRISSLICSLSTCSDGPNEWLKHYLSPNVSRSSIDFICIWPVSTFTCVVSMSLPTDSNQALQGQSLSACRTPPHSHPFEAPSDEPSVISCSQGSVTLPLQAEARCFTSAPGNLFTPPQYLSMKLGYTESCNTQRRNRCGNPSHRCFLPYETRSGTCTG